jgi:hypothetical protein
MFGGNADMNTGNGIINGGFFGGMPFPSMFQQSMPMPFGGDGMSFSSSSSSVGFGGGGGGMRSVSTSTRIVNGQRTSVTTTVDEQGNKTIKTLMPDGTEQVTINGGTSSLFT